MEDDVCNEILPKRSNNTVNIYSSDMFTGDMLPKNNQRRWSLTEDKMLLQYVKEYTDSKIRINWLEISTRIEGKSRRQCYSRYAQINPTINKGLWSKKEDDDLLYYISKYGKKWSLIANVMKTRNSKQIRDRYLNCLDEKVSRIPFTSEEDKLIIELIQRYGSNWSRIAKEIKGRTGDNIKNRFNWSIKQTLTSQIDFKKISII